MHDFDLGKIYEEAISILKGPAILGALGYLGLQLTKDDPNINHKKLVGGMLVAGVVGYCLGNILPDYGLSPSAAGALAGMIGAQGPAGLEWFSSKVRKIVDKKIG